ncbi:MAG TPA: hypothetical protein VI547_06040 [Anaerolineales bacterium]|nr:hypothetical protein [Anaerolineales bacterium]
MRALLLTAAISSILLQACKASEAVLTATPSSGPALNPPATPLIIGTATVTPEPSATVTRLPTATTDPSATAVVLDPCTLITQAEAASVLGEPVSDGALLGGGCVFVDTAAAQHIVSVYAVPANSAYDVLTGHMFLLTAFGLQINTLQNGEIKSLALAGDSVGVVDRLIYITDGNTLFASQRVNGLGDSAIWISRVAGTVRQSFLIVARGQSVAGIDLVVTSLRAEESARDSAKAMMETILSRLPAKFTLGSTQPVSTAPPSPTLSGTPPTPTPSPSGTQPTVDPTLTPLTLPSTPTAQIKPPAFSVPVVSTDQFFYGGACGTPVVTITATVVDPGNGGGIVSVSIFFRLVDSLATGQVTEWTSLPMRNEGGPVWSRAFFSERDIPGYNSFLSASLEYFIVAFNAAGLGAESPHYGLQTNKLTLSACPAPTPTQTPQS